MFLQAHGARYLWGHLLDGHPEPAPSHLSGVLELAEDVLGHIDGRGETQTLARCHDGGVDPYDLALHVDERATRVSRVDGRIGLDEVVIGSGTDDPRLGGNDPLGEGVTEAEGIAQGNDPLPDLQGIGIAEHGHREIPLFGLDLDERYVGLVVGPDPCGRELFLVRQ